MKYVYGAVMTSPTYLYRHYDKKGVLLYVGITSNVQRRTAAHSRNSVWARDAVRTVSECYPTLIKAAIAELQAIDKEKPLHNVVPGRDRRTKLSDAIMFSARIPAELLRKMDSLCKKKKTLRSDFIRDLLEARLK